jgi:thiol-disulfide isomerase/thioredoxin
MLTANPTTFSRPTSFTTLARRGIFLVIGMFCVLVLVGPAPVVTSQDTDAAEAELTKGRTFLRRSQFEEALKSFKRANDMREKKCAECLSLMADAYYGLEEYKKVVETADKAIALAGDNKQLVTKVYINKGLALQAAAEKKDQKKLQGAEAAFRQAMAFENAPPVTHYNLGVVLLQMNRDPEGIAEIQQYLKAQPNGFFAESAKKMAGNPRRARENYAPDFSFTSLSGEQVSLDGLQGKVVLLDFWGTWCGPCVESVPELKQLHKKYANEPAFVLIGISSDRDDEVWREFTVKNKMAWPQYRDKDGKIMRAFRVGSFPTYVILDHEGIIRHRSVGMTWSRASSLDSEIKKQIKMIPKSVASD